MFQHKLVSVGLSLLALTCTALASPARVTRYVIVSHNSTSGSFESGDAGRLHELRAKYGPEFVWFHYSGHEYIVTNPQAYAEFQNAMAPQREVNEHQDAVNRRQDEVNRQQDRVNSLQDGVNRAQSEVNREQNL